jgi:hypothetical protein|tara:strand:- start:4779 stop:4964 length:186 start_codon:yes stop_codon:yes gene_type:complete
MEMKIKLDKNSSFNSEQHFFDCLTDLLNEWNESEGPKEMEEQDTGFNSNRYRELKKFLITV